MFGAVLWIVQVLTAVIFVLAGGVKLLLPREKLQERMHWATSWPRWRIKLLGAAELAGAVGLVVPPLTGVLPVLAPIAALCLAALMIGAVRAHAQLGEGIAPAAIVGVLCLAIAVAHFH